MRRGTFMILMIMAGLTFGGCKSTAQNAGRNIVEGAFDGARSTVDKWWKEREPEFLAKAEEANRKAEAAALAKVEEKIGPAAAKAVEANLPVVRAFVEPLIDKGLDRGEELIMSKVEAKAAEIRAKQESGQPLDTLDYFWLFLAASGLGAGGVTTAKAMIRKLLGLKIPVERIDNGNGTA